MTVAKEGAGNGECVNVYRKDCYMHIWGLNVIDILIVVVYLIGMLYVGMLLSKKVHGQDDFYLAGRKLGKLYQFFLNFGKMTDANGAVSVSSVVYSEGIGGVWIAMQTLLMTPYYWFMNKWFRRVRLITIGDLFEDRFGGKSLAVMFAGFNILFAVTFIAFGYLVSCKTMRAMMVKPETEYTAAETQMITDYENYKELRSAYELGELDQEKYLHYEELKNLYNKGQLHSYVSYVNPLIFYIIYGLIVGSYVVMGGFGAAVVTDAFQAVLIVLFSFILIPFGLFRLGGFRQLHITVPDYMFKMFGSGGASEYTWYSILAILFVSLVQIHAMPGNMAVAGSAKNEFAARMGAVTGGFGKRLMIICWSFCALIALGLFYGQISDPDLTWGVLTKGLLSPGFIGLMLAGILAANMSSIDAYAVNQSALFTRNLYMPVFPDRSERHYVLVGRIAIVVFLVLGVAVALYITGVVALLKFLIVMNVTFGAPIFLLFFWRRLTKTAVIVEVVLCVVVIVLLPWIVPSIPSLYQDQALTVQTYERVEDIEITATINDVENLLADEVGQKIVKKHTIEPQACFFDKVVRVDPYDATSPLTGVGRFNIELYIISRLGIDVRSMTPSIMLTIRFIFDGIFPFVILFIVSWLTKPTDKERLDRFYVKMKTEVQPTPELDKKEIERSLADLSRFDHMKVFSGSSWEFVKWNKVDLVGFLLCCMAVVIILGIFCVVLNIGR